MMRWWCAVMLGWSAGAHGAEPACGEAPAWSELQVAQGGVLLVGEIHGTREIPRWVASVACVAAQDGTSVMLGLEIPTSAEPALLAFVDSEGGERARDALLAQGFWQRRAQDGRSSRAIFDLVDAVRRFKGAGLPITVYAMDQEAGADATLSRDARMAARIGELVTGAPQARHLVLTGNLHNRTRPGTPWDSEFRPAGLLLRASGVAVTSLDVDAPSHSVWVCLGPNPEDCGIRGKLRKVKPGAFKEVEHVDPPTVEGFDGVYRITRLTASPPAIQEP